MSTPRSRARASRKAQGLAAVMNDTSVLTTIAGVLRPSTNGSGSTEAEPSSGTSIRSTRSAGSRSLGGRRVQHET
jgi:hypothetical protein